MNAHLGHKIAVLYNQGSKRSHYGYTNLFSWPSCNLLNEVMNKIAVVSRDGDYGRVQACGLLNKTNLATTTAKCPAYQPAESYTEPWHAAPYHGWNSSHQIAGWFLLNTFHHEGSSDWPSLEETLILDGDLSSLEAMLLPSPPSVYLLNSYSLSQNPTQYCSDKRTHFTAKRVRQWAKTQGIC